MFNNINTYDGRGRSQNGEDGIIKEIIFRVGVVERYAVELGVESGAECNSAYWSSTTAGPAF